MIEIIGKYNTAICYTDILEDSARTQIQAVCDEAAFAASKIRIMPDVHAGKGCTIGTTMTIHDKLVPGMVGVDIGCGMETIRIAEKEIDFEKLDLIIRKNIPCGRNVRDIPHHFNSEIDIGALHCVKHVKLEYARQSIGTLGGGNHFIELNRDDDGNIYLVVHSGSRHLGCEVANYYQSVAGGLLKSTEMSLAYVDGESFDDYIHDMKIVQKFAALNRMAITENIIKEIGFTVIESFTTVHNYIDTDMMILRKGSVSAKAGEKLLIPINMRDGSLICTGLGNSDWNFSAPHGAGRIMSRSAAFTKLSIEEYEAQMKGIYSTCISKNTLDESPMAYKSMTEIIGQISPTAQIIRHIKPIYNFKASE